MGLVLKGTLRMAGVGLACGLLLAGGAARLMGSLLYEVKPLDPATYLAVAAVLAATLLLASAIPARRAATVDPTSMLK
jgi:putative ABC transport system permease protein